MGDKMMYTCANAYYFRSINAIGGIESHLYYISKKYKDLDITVFYVDGDEHQISRLKRNVRCKKINYNDKVICKRLFCCFNREILNKCEAEEKILVLHGDYLDMVNRGQLAKENLPIDERIDKYIGVSQTICDSWKALTGIDAENVYQPVIIDKVDKPLLFCSATRLTKEKGWKRMLKLADTLEASGIKFIWHIYTDAKINKDEFKMANKNMVFLEPKLDITDYFGAFDAYIQLSDSEGFCLSVVEALMRGTPIICTDLPVFKELGLNDSNSIKLDMDLSNIPIERIKDICNMKFSYAPPEDKWSDILVKEKSNYNISSVYKVRALGTYEQLGIKDSVLNRVPVKGEEFEIIGDDRLDVLLGDNFKNEPFVELICKIS